MRVFAVGDLNIDLFILSEKNFVFGEEKKADEVYFTLGGNAANFSVAASALGIKTSLVSALGKDIYSSFILQALKKYGVEPLLMRSASPNGVSSILVRPGGGRAIISSKGALLELDSVTVSQKLLPRVKSGDAVYFGGFFHLPRLRKGFAALLRKLRRKGCLILFDATFDEYNKWGVKGFARLVDYFFLNHVELEKITGTSVTLKAIKILFGMGFGNIVLKQGKKGASFFSKREKANCHALKVKAYNSTGAGDFFNAGFVYGLSKNYSHRNSLLCGNLVAAKRISNKGYFVASKKMLEQFLEKQRLVEVKVATNYNSLSKKTASMIIGQLRDKPSSVLCLAAGNTPIGTYKRLVSAHNKGLMNFSKATFVELDEYLCGKSEDSFAYFLNKNLLEKVNFRLKKVFMFDRTAFNVHSMCRKFDGIIKKRGIDLLLLGVGENGHIAYNEPGTPFTSNTHIVKLSKRLLRGRRKKFLGSPPTHAVTLGMKQIMSAKKIVLIASGRKKARAVALALNSRPSPALPASLLQLHGNSAFIVDKRAATLLSKRLVANG